MKRFGVTPLPIAATLFLAGMFVPGGFAQEPMMAPAKATPAPMTPPKRLTNDEMLKRYDKNGDGKIDDDERAEAREQMMKEQIDRQMARAAATPGGLPALQMIALEMFDANRDGMLNDEERAAARKFADEHVLGTGGEVRSELIKQFDRNANGQIDPDERPAFIAHLRERLSTAGKGGNPDAAAARLKMLADEVEKRRVAAGDPSKRGALDAELKRRGEMRESVAPGGGPESGPSERVRLEAVAGEIAQRRELREKIRAELSANPNWASMPEYERRMAVEEEYTRRQERERKQSAK